MVAMSNPWKNPRTGTYYIRRGVPAELRKQLGREYKRSLKTKDPKEAVSKFPLALAKSQQLFEQAKANLSRHYQRVYSKDEIDRFSDAWLAMMLEEDEDFRMEGLNDGMFAKY